MDFLHYNRGAECPHEVVDYSAEVRRADVGWTWEARVRFKVAAGCGVRELEPVDDTYRHVVRRQSRTKALGMTRALAELRATLPGADLGLDRREAGRG